MRDPSEVIALLDSIARAWEVEARTRKNGPGTLSLKRCAETLREHAKVIATLPASTPPADACVRHACKRVRMEMQAEIERLRGLLRRWLALDSERDYVLRGETAAEVKGDSHAG